MALLQAAAAAKYKDSDDDPDLATIALLIALADDDATAASIALATYDPATVTHAALLPLYIRWMAHIGDDRDRQVAQARLVQLRADAQDVLAGSGLSDTRILAAR